MPLTKVLLAELYDGAAAYDYINPGLVASIDVLADSYLVVLGNRIEYKVSLDDVSITALKDAADTAYTPPP